MPVCDICNKPIAFSDGYSLTTREVVLTTHYWKLAFRGGLSCIHQTDPSGGESLMHYIEQQAAQHTGWLVCEECSAPLRFDRLRARRLAENRQDPPDAGPVSPLSVVNHAIDAWKQLYGSVPRMTRFSDTIISRDRVTGEVNVFRPGSGNPSYVSTRGDSGRIVVPESGRTKIIRAVIIVAALMLLAFIFAKVN